MFNLILKIQVLKHHAKEWNKTTFGSIFKTIATSREGFGVVFKEKSLEQRVEV